MTLVTMVTALKPAWTGPFSGDFACSPCACLGSLQVLRLPQTTQRHAHEVNWWL